MSDNIRKYLVPNFPYLMAFCFFTKIGRAYRLASGGTFGQKVLFGLMEAIGKEFQTLLPGLTPFDLLVGVAGAVVLYLVVQSRIKNARKFRRDMEYGTARWSA